MGVSRPAWSGGNAGTATTTTVTSSAKSFIEGLVLSWSSVTAVQIAAGSCRNSSDTTDITVSGTLTATITVSGANGLDTGSEANVWYAVHVISGTSGQAALLSASGINPTLPAGYTVFRRVGWVKNHNGNLMNFLQVGKANARVVYHKEPGSVFARPLNNAVQANDVGVYTNVDCSAFIAPTADQMIMRFTSTAGGTGSAEWLARDADNNVWTRTRQDRSEYFIGKMPCPTNKGIKWRTSTGSVRAQVIVMGWEEWL